jgi:hypothetical protein
MIPWIPLIVNVVLLIAGLAVAWGVFQAKLANAEKSIESKLDKAVFDLHRQNDDTRITGIQDWLKRIDEKLDRLIEKK